MTKKKTKTKTTAKKKAKTETKKASTKKAATKKSATKKAETKKAKKKKPPRVGTKAHLDKVEETEGKQAVKELSQSMVMFDPKALEIVGLDTDDGPEHPLYDERISLPLDESLVKSIMARGIVEPIQVRKDGGKEQVVFGRQRVRAAREANRRLKKAGKMQVKVPSVSAHGTDLDMLGVNITENEHRQDDKPMAKARKLKRYLDMGGTEEGAAVDFGVTTKSIKNWLVLLDLDASVQKSVEDGTLSASAAAGLAKLPRKEQKEQLTELVETATQNGKKVTQRTAEAKTGNVTAKTKAPSKKVLKRLISAYGEDESRALVQSDVDESFITGVRFALGDIPPNRIKGMTKVLKEIEG